VLEGQHTDSKTSAPRWNQIVIESVLSYLPTEPEHWSYYMVDKSLLWIRRLASADRGLTQRANLTFCTAQSHEPERASPASPVVRIPSELDVSFASTKTL
jgi:hypothetical protein